MMITMADTITRFYRVFSDLRNYKRTFTHEMLTPDSTIYMEAYGFVKK